jgi:predicted DNA-binding protein (MmcQ/YjbR family)
MDEDLRELLCLAAERYPQSSFEFPWGERVAKVNKKIFVFLGSDDATTPTVSLKLPDSAHHALSLGGARSTGYGLGRAGWVTLDLAVRDAPDAELLLDWLEESYRAIAPKRLVALLEQHEEP